MPVLGAPHQAVVTELTEWWEDQWQRGIGPAVVLLLVPERWGRSTVLDRLAETVSARGDPVTLVVHIKGRELPERPLLQALAIGDLLTGPVPHSVVAELLGADTPAGAAQLGLGAAGLLVTGPAVVAVWLATIAAGAAGKLWEDSADRPRGVVARAAGSLAEASRSAPVVVLIDDAECVDRDLALTLLEGLAFRPDGQMLAVVAAGPGSGLAAALAKGERFGLAGMVHAADADPDMGYQSRVGLARELRPGLPDAAIRQIGQRTRTFAEVFTVASAEILAEVRPDDDLASVKAAVDAVVDARLMREPPTARAVMVAWAEGPVHTRQVDAAIAASKSEAAEGWAGLVRSGSLVRLTDPSEPRPKAAASALAPTTRLAMAKAVLDEALGICADPVIPLLDRIVAGQAAHRVRRYLDEQDRERLVRVQRELIACLEQAGDMTAAAEVADAALAEWPADGQELVRAEVAAAKLRFAVALPRPDDPLVEELTTEALAGGAATSLEARVWAAINLLEVPGRRDAALMLTDQVTDDLESRFDLASTVGWRLLLAFHAGRADYPAITQRLLGPLLTSTDTNIQDTAGAVLRAGSGPQADIRLQIAMLEADLRPEQSDEDSLRLHAALASAYAKVGDYQRAADHAEQELRLRERLQGDDHPATLTNRHELARWTGKAGNPAALEQLAALLPDMERVFGRKHPATLTAWHDYVWTGRTADPARARDEFAALLPDFEQVFGLKHQDTLTIRQNFATCTREAGDAAAARDQLAALLPDYERVFGPRHRETLTARLNHASCVGDAGDPARARQQLEELLPDYVNVFGAGHPESLTVRLDLAYFTGHAGDPAGALDQLQELLPVFERVFGPQHMTTFDVRIHLSFFTWMVQGGSGTQ